MAGGSSSIHLCFPSKVSSGQCVGPEALLAAHRVTSCSAVLLQELCLYTLGNLVVESEAVRKQLLPQGIIPVLASCIQVGETAQPHFCCALETFLATSPPSSCGEALQGAVSCGIPLCSFSELISSPAESPPSSGCLVCSTGSPVPSAWPGSIRAVVCRSKCSNQDFCCVWAKPSEHGEGDSSAVVWSQVPLSLLVPSVPPLLQVQLGLLGSLALSEGSALFSLLAVPPRGSAGRCGLCPLTAPPSQGSPHRDHPVSLSL